MNSRASSEDENLSFVDCDSSDSFLDWKIAQSNHNCVPALALIVQMLKVNTGHCRMMSFLKEVLYRYMWF